MRRRGRALVFAPQFTPQLGQAKPLTLLAPDGSLRGDREPKLSPEAVSEALRLMTLSRAFDRRAFSLQRQGRFGIFSPVEGQEASVVGAAMALDPDRDWVVPQYRELPALLRQGLPLERFALYCMGHPAGGVVPEGVNVLPIQIALAAQLPHAVGLAWGFKLQRRDGVVMAYSGDGATSEGDFHEACNLAGARRAPIVFVVQNNGWAISTPRRLQSAAPTLASRAVGYGFPGALVDGNDLFAVHAVAAEAVDRARSGGGPTLIETLTYRMGPHNTADDPSRYTDEAVREQWRQRDPIRRVQRYLEAQGRWDDEAASALTEEVRAQVADALERAWSQPPPSPDDLFDHVFGVDPPRLAEQRQAFRSPAAKPPTEGGDLDRGSQWP